MERSTAHRLGGDVEAELQDRVGLALGRTVRQGRNARGWTLDELAHRSNISRRLIVQIEQAQANPSIGTLLRLADALGVTLSTLLGEEPARMYRVQHTGDEVELWRGDRGGTACMLVSHGPLELWRWVLAPDEWHESEAHRSGSSELLSVHTGSLYVEVGGERFSLATGDSAWMDAAQPHVYRNSKRFPVRFTMVVFEP